jgi:4-amino-4-deoxy-L-arabinose transferase-like glycosyltransferase
VDEFGNLPLTIAFWGPGALHIDPGNPPLTRWLQGLPFLADPPALGRTTEELAGVESSWELGYWFEWAHRADYHDLLVRARAVSVVLLLATVLGVYVWAHDLAGLRGGLLAGALAAASPNLLAHGRLVTPDIGLACFVVWAAWATDRARGTGPASDAAGGRDLAWTALAGLLTGLACLAKLPGLVLVPVLGIALCLAPGSGRRRLLRGALFVAVVLLVLYAAYGFPPPGSVRSLPTPLPAPYVSGIATQLDEEPYWGYLLGEVRNVGWPHYYLVAFLVKVPVPVLLLGALAVVASVRERRRDCALPLVLAAVFFVALGLVTKKNVGLRYVLPVLPLLHVAVVAALPASGATGRARTWRPAAVGLLAAVAVIGGVLASATPLAYFNGVERLRGGKRQVLVDSNLDWGQALPDLRDWMAREGVRTIRLAYFGRVDPALYGIDWYTLPLTPTDGACAMSATLAVGRPYLMRIKRHRRAQPEYSWSRPDSWAWLRDREPDAELGGGSILVWKSGTGGEPVPAAPTPPTTSEKRP